MKDEKFTLNHAIHNADGIQLQGVKIGSHQVTIDISKIHARKIIPEVLLEEEWSEYTPGEGTITDYDFHCPETGMIFATYYKGNTCGYLTINHNAN